MIPTLRQALPGLACLALAALPAAQKARPSGATPTPLPPRSVVPAGWFSGDTHEHIQQCDDTVLPVPDLLARMAAEDLDVASILIWHRSLLPYVEFVCNVTQAPVPSEKVVRFGVETSGLSCSLWGHLIGLGIGASQARVAFGATASGACTDMPGLGLPGDGSGLYNTPVAEQFFTAPGAVCGYAHTIWTSGLYHPEGHDWNTELLASGFTTDARFLDPGQPLAVPSIDRLFGLSVPPNSARFFFPLLGAADAILGNVQFIETIVAGPTIPFPTTPPAHWNQLYYKLLSAGVRIGLAGGSDRACFPTAAGDTPMRTHVKLDGPLTYRGWTDGLARGRATIADGKELFLRLNVAGAEVGSDVPAVAGVPLSGVRVLIRSAVPLADTVELLVNGTVVRSQAVTVSADGERTVAFDDVVLGASSWIAARLGSQLAHTAALYAIVDGRPVADPIWAEYWMLWYDLVAKTILDHPERAWFGSQEGEVLAQIARARRAFKTLRDQSFEPSWGITRHGRSLPACRGPITIGAMGPARAGATLRLTCMNAPPSARGVLVLSTRPLGPGGSTPFHLAPRTLLGSHPVLSSRSGYAEVVAGPIPAGVPELHAQFFWENPLECRGSDDGARSASDRLRLQVQ